MEVTPYTERSGLTYSTGDSEFSVTSEVMRHVMRGTVQRAAEGVVDLVHNAPALLSYEPQGPFGSGPLRELQARGPVSYRAAIVDRGGNKSFRKFTHKQIWLVFPPNK